MGSLRILKLVLCISTVANSFLEGFKVATGNRSSEALHAPFALKQCRRLPEDYVHNPIRCEPAKSPNDF